MNATAKHATWQRPKEPDVTDDLHDELPKPAAIVQSHLPVVFRHITDVESSELDRLLTKQYANDQFHLNYAFAKTVEQIPADRDTGWSWKTEHQCWATPCAYAVNGLFGTDSSSPTISSPRAGHPPASGRSAGSNRDKESPMVGSTNG